MKTFKEKVLEIVAKIRPGTTMTYAHVATLAGNPNAARAVGNIISKNFDPAIPCHRVIRTDGSLGGYNRGGIESKKKKLLAQETAFESSD